MITIELDALDWEKAGGLIPVVAQSEGNLEVLTLAYTNREALQLTLKTGWAHYYRRSYGKVMMKGEKSGNVQKIKQILTDCDNDALIYKVEQTGPACHLGERTCFHKLVARSRARDVR